MKLALKQAWNKFLEINRGLAQGAGYALRH